MLFEWDGAAPLDGGNGADNGYYATRDHRWDTLSGKTTFNRDTDVAEAMFEVITSGEWHYVTPRKQIAETTFNRQTIRAVAFPNKDGRGWFVASVHPLD